MTCWLTGWEYGIAQKNQVIPNIELKFLKDDIDRCVLRDRLYVRIAEGDLSISPLEIQIAYKLFLGSKKRNRGCTLSLGDI